MSKTAKIYYFEKYPGEKTIQNITGFFYTTMKLTKFNTAYFKQFVEVDDPVNYKATEIIGTTVFCDVVIVSTKHTIINKIIPKINKNNSIN